MPDAGAQVEAVMRRAYRGAGQRVFGGHSANVRLADHPARPMLIQGYGGTQWPRDGHAGYWCWR
jgi:hypothetical protein